MSTLSPGRAELHQAELRSLLGLYVAGLEMPTRLPTLRELGRKYGASASAVQAALAGLAQSGAVDIESRRHSGMVLRGRDVGALWLAARGGPIVIALPLPTGLRIHGLATALKACLGKCGIDASLIFSRGSLRRLVALRSARCHAVVMSTLGSDEACGSDDIIVLRLPVGSYGGAHRVYQRELGAIPPLHVRVAIDRDSVDLKRLTELEFGDQDVEFIPATFLEFLTLLGEGRADVAIADADEVPAGLPAGVTSRPLSQRVRDAFGDSETRAAVVTRRDDALSQAVIRECLGGATFISIQREVLEGRRVPEY